MHTLAPTVPSDVRVLLQGLDILGGTSCAQSAALAATRTPDRLLGDALSLAETVRLGAELARSVAEAAAAAADQEAHERWSSASAAKLHALRRRVDHVHASAFSGKAALPDAARMHAMLVELGALGDKPASRARVSAIWAASHAQLLSALLAQLRRELELFKYDCVAQLRALGPAAEALVQVDTTLDAAIARMSVAAVQRLCSAFEARCSAQFEREIAALPEGCDPSALQPMHSPRGVATRLLESSRRLAHALLDLEWSALQGLIDAVCLPTSRADCAP